MGSFFFCWLLSRHDIILNHNLPKQKSIASVCRQHANNSFEGKRIDPVGFGEVFLCREILEVFGDVKPPDSGPTKRYDMINVMAVWAICNKLVEDCFITPLGSGAAYLFYFLKIFSALRSPAKRCFIVSLSLFAIFRFVILV